MCICCYSLPFLLDKRVQQYCTIFIHYYRQCFVVFVCSVSVWYDTETEWTNQSVKVFWVLELMVSFAVLVAVFYHHLNKHRLVNLSWLSVANLRVLHHSFKILSQWEKVV